MPSEPLASATKKRANAGLLGRLIATCVRNKLIPFVLLAFFVGGGLISSPFLWQLGELPRSPVAVDAIPDVGENQQIVFTEWPGRSPRDIEDQVSYPLTTSLLGIAGVRTVRSFSMFGFSTVYVIFEEGVDFYWSRSRLLEKLASLPKDMLPPGVSPSLGPDATALGQVFWYTLEGRSLDGATAVGGWDPQELRTVQDWNVRYALQSVPGVSEVASVGGFVKEYQIDIDSAAMQAAGVGIDEIANAVRMANLDVGARTLELNRAEYVVRGVGFVQSADDLEQIVIRSVAHTPIRVADVAKVSVGPAPRRGALDKNGAPAVGGVVVVRFGANPLQVIERVKAKIAEVSVGLPTRTLEGGQKSKVTIVPFYDRSTLIHETLSTLSTALLQQILVTLLVVLSLLRNLRSALLISSLLPVGVLGTFVLMRASDVDANVMALSGIAIAIGTMVDMGIVLAENITSRLNGSTEGESKSAVVIEAATEVAPAVLTSTLTTIIGFLPIFALTAAEGRLFAPLAQTKTFAMLVALVLAIAVLPAVAALLLGKEKGQHSRERKVSAPKWFEPSLLLDICLVGGGIWIAVQAQLSLGLLVVILVILRRAQRLVPTSCSRRLPLLSWLLSVLVLGAFLADEWLPLGAAEGSTNNRVFVAVVLISLLGTLTLFIRIYPLLLTWALRNKALSLSVPTAFVVAGLTCWLGFASVFSWLPDTIRSSRAGTTLAHSFPGLGKEYMPPFDEGSYLFMPTTMPHASMGETLSQLQQMDAAISAIPEVADAVGKLGRVESALDPAPISMYEVVVNYKPEYKLDDDGARGTYRFDESDNAFARDPAGALVPDEGGKPYRQWRESIRSSRDIWEQIRRVTARPGLTQAPELMPIAARIIMLQSGMRAPLGLKIQGPDLRTLEEIALRFEAELKQVPGVRPETVVADRLVGKPYLEIVIRRREIARHGLSVAKVQEVIQTGVGGSTVTRTIEGRQRYGVRLRYMREQRDSLEALKRVLVPTPLGHPIPLEQLVFFRYVRGPQVIKSEDTLLTAYVVFDKDPNRDEVSVVQSAEEHLRRSLATDRLKLPEGFSYRFTGSYENQLRSDRTLSFLVPLALATIFLLLYLQFGRAFVALSIFSGAAVAMAGGFVFIWLYGTPWFLDFQFAGVDLRELFKVHTTNLSVGVWVGFIALLGIATDDGVVMSSYLKRRFDESACKSISEVRARTLEAGLRRVRPCLMTTGTTLLALLPVIISSGRGSDVMLPMALPLVGGMAIELVTLFVVPVLYCWAEERRFRKGSDESPALTGSGAFSGLGDG